MMIRPPLYMERIYGTYIRIQQTIGEARWRLFFNSGGGEDRGAIQYIQLMVDVPYGEGYASDASERGGVPALNNKGRGTTGRL